MKKTLLILAAGSISLFNAASVFARTTLDELPLQHLILQGNATYNVWNTLNDSGMPGTGGFPGSGDWSGNMASEPGAYVAQISSGGLAGLKKVSNGTGGGPFAAGGSLYYGGFSPIANTDGGTVAVFDSNPLANLQTIAFQIEIGEAYGFDFYNDILPVLTIQHAGGTATVAADMSAVLGSVANGTFPTPVGEEDLYTTLYGLQWDVGSYTGITHISIDFTAVQHASVYGVRLDQSDYNYGSEFVFAVPEPATYALLLGGGMLGLVVVRRRFAKKSR